MIALTLLFFLKKNHTKKYFPTVIYFSPYMTFLHSNNILYTHKLFVCYLILSFQFQTNLVRYWNKWEKMLTNFHIPKYISPSL